MKLILLREKHGDRYIVLDKEGTWKKAVLLVLRRRLEDGWYAAEEPVKPEAVIDEMPPGAFRLRDLVQAQWSEYQAAVERYNRDRVFLAAVKRALDENDGDLGLRLLKSRDGNEYEDISEEIVEN